jgi:23S rRNA C2498 (ribose-2'-O)-methylase RlmM
MKTTATACAMGSPAVVSGPVSMNRIFVGNLENCSEVDVRTCFEHYGPLESVHYVRNKFAFVTFVHERHAQKAFLTCEQYKVGRPTERKRKWKETECVVENDECMFLKDVPPSKQQQQQQQQLVVLQCNASHAARMRDHIQPNNIILASIRRKQHELLFLTHPMEDSSTLLFDNPHVKRALNAVFVVTNQSIIESDVGQQALDLISKLPNNARVRLQTFPAHLQLTLAASLTSLENGILSPSDYTHVLSLLKVNESVCFMGVVKADKLVCFANKDTSLEKKGDIPRAYYKLQEALERFGGNVKSQLKRKVALDCGAAPGGWTQYLMEQGCSKVYSVDPGDLLPSVLTIHGVEHLKMKLQDAIGMLPQNSIHVFVSDMCLHEMESQIDFMVKAKPLLTKNALFVLTLKCVAGHSDSSYNLQVGKVVSRLEGICFGVKTMHLFVNRRRERTVIGYLQ